MDGLTHLRLLDIFTGMAKGGKQPGAGRPKGSLARHTIQAQEIKAYLIQRALEEQGPIIEALLRKARNGDLTAIKDVLDRVLGKATDKIEMSGEVGLPFQIVIRQKETPTKDAGKQPGDTAI